MIQIITGEYATKRKFENNKEYEVSDFKNPKAFEDFELNILDLGFENLWYNKSRAKDSINMIKDLMHYKNIISDSDNTKILIIIPQNIIYNYYFANDKYYSNEYLKNMLKFIEELFVNHIFAYAFQLNFATTNTTLKGTNIKADFYFNKQCFNKEERILESDTSKKLTTIKVKENLYYTTLDLMKNKESLEAFLQCTKIIRNEETAEPEWVKEVNILDDVEIKDKVKQLENSIKDLEEKKMIEIQKLIENNKIKSILYQTDKNLQIMIIQMLNEMLEYEDKDFVDKMEEDYKIKKDDITFIIETKGLLRNVKGEDISKTLNHVEIYLDELEEKELTENVKGIYIVATQRNKKVEKREKTPDRQITLAKRNNVLIIRTEQFLKLFEAYRNKKISTDEIKELFKKEIGEFQV